MIDFTIPPPTLALQQRNATDAFNLPPGEWNQNLDLSVSEDLKVDFSDTSNLSL